MKVQALQVCEVSQVYGESVQTSSQTFVTRQVQLFDRREVAERTTCRSVGGVKRQTAIIHF